jgi:pyrrolidone-carboxylate peptidase
MPADHRSTQTTSPDLVHAIGDAVGRPLRCERVAPDDYRDALVADGLSHELSDAAVS